MDYVIDTSVLAKVFLAEPEHDRVAALIEACIRGETKPIAPSLLLYEVNNALLSNGVRGTEYADAIARIMWWMRAKVIEISEPDEDLLRRAEAIASMDTQGQGHISSYDATFHALALMSGSVFVTSDQSYVRKTKALLGSVELLQDISL